MSCLKKNNIKIYIKTAPKYFGAVTPSSWSAIIVLTKFTVVKICCILKDYFNNCNVSKHELMRSLMMA